MKKIILSLLLSGIFSAGFSQMKNQDSVMKAWFPEAKFGVFVHWMPTFEGGKELMKNDYAEYQKRAYREAKLFTASNYKPDEWAAMFSSWGAKYVVLTTKHHLGFALYDEKNHSFDAKKASPAKRDLLREYANAMRSRGLKVGFYFSLSDRMNPDYFSLSVSDDGKTVNWQKSDFVRWKKFTDQMLAEIKHLSTAYGQVDLFWFDGDWERSADMWRSMEIYDTIRKYQPQAVINNRLGHIELGDYATPEMIVPGKRFPGWFEFCTTLGYNWAGPDAHKDLKEAPELVRIFGDVITLGGNVLLNIAPDYSGHISVEQQQRMALLGKWIVDHAEAVYGTSAGLPWGLFNGGSTRKGSTIYLIVYESSKYELVVKGLEGTIESVTHLATGSPLQWRNMNDYHNDEGRKGWRFITLPEELKEEYATVIKITFKNNMVTVTDPNKVSVVWKD